MIPFKRFLFITPFFFSFLFFSSPTFAVDNWTITVSSNTTVYLCGSGSSTPTRNSEPCSSYQYIYYEFSGDHLSSSNRATGINFSGDLYPSYKTLTTSNLPSYSGYLDVSDYAYFHFSGVSNAPDSWSLTLSALTSLPSDETPCPVCPTIPENPYDNKFDDVVKAIYTCGAIMLVLYFFYSIYRIIIKTTGGY